MLAFLLTGESVNRFEAERRLSDHTLPSTIATLQNKGVMVLRHDETVPGYQGIVTHVTRYWIESSPANIQRARELLGLAAAPPREQLELPSAWEGR